MVHVVQSNCARAKPLRELTDAEWITTSITPTAWSLAPFLSATAIGAETEVGTHGVNMPSVLRLFGDGAVQFDDGTIREPRFTAIPLKKESSAPSKRCRRRAAMPRSPQQPAT